VVPWDSSRLMTLRLCVPAHNTAVAGEVCDTFFRYATSHIVSYTQYVTHNAQFSG
jgi:uncharacterized membrane protein